MSISKNLIIAILAIAVVIVGGYYFTTGQQENVVQIKQKGSDTLLILVQNWAEAYMADNTDVEIVVNGGGSGTGISALINKQIDIADASREIKQQELKSAEEAGVEPVEWRVALDGISIIVNKDNSIGELDYLQLKAIYEGSVTSWSEVVGVEGAIVTYGRQSTSGTYGYFQEEVLEEEDYRTDMNQLSGNADIVEAVINDPNGIGYVGVAYADARKGELKILGIKRDPAGTAYQPTADNIANGKYPLSRYLYVYTDGVPEGAIADYIKFMLSSEGQGITEEVGYIPIPQSIVTEQLSNLG